MFTPPEEFRITPITILVLVLLGLAWPVVSFYFLETQLEMAKEIVCPLEEVYYSTMIVQLFTLLIVLVAVRSEKTGLSDVGLINFHKWTLLQALLFLAAANLVLILLQAVILSGAPDSVSSVAGLLPKTQSEKLVWLILCLIVAVSEELTFRGYIITRISRLFGGRIWIGIILSSIAFASGHLYQGLGGFVLIFIYGLMFSMLYVKTKSLYPGIIAHFIQDAIVLVVPDL